MFVPYHGELARLNSMILRDFELRLGQTPDGRLKLRNSPPGAPQGNSQNRIWQLKQSKTIFMYKNNVKLHIFQCGRKERLKIS